MRVCHCPGHQPRRAVARHRQQDKTARLWPLTIEELLKQAERAVGRNFTREEWEELFPGEHYRKTFEGLPAPN